MSDKPVSQSRLEQRVSDITRNVEAIAMRGVAAWRELLISEVVRPLRSAIRESQMLTDEASSGPDAKVRSVFATYETSYPDEFSNFIRCPVCDCDCVHLEDNTHAPNGRGTRIVTSFYCECNHRFALVLQFHKGTTFAKIEVLEAMTEESPGPGLEMWRS